jgi:hypothetical protein
MQVITAVCNSVCTSWNCSRQHQKLLTKLFLINDRQFHIKMAKISKITITGKLKIFKNCISNRIICSRSQPSVSFYCFALWRKKKFVIVHQDHISKFMLFHALKTKLKQAAYNPNSILLMIRMSCILNLNCHHSRSGKNKYTLINLQAFN